jgi:hypothetical protein
MSNPYETDIIAWANEQAALLRAGKFSEVDIAHIAEEIEDVGKSERRELASRMSVLLAHLLKWQFQPDRRGSSWQRTIKEQRRAIASHLRETPSLKTSLADQKKTSLADQNWKEGLWADAIAKAFDEAGLGAFPEICPWTVEEILSLGFYPD